MKTRIPEFTRYTATICFSRASNPETFSVREFESVPKVAWTGGSSPNRQSIPDDKRPIFDGFTRLLFREQIHDFTAYWKRMPNLDTVRIFWNRARHDAWASIREAGWVTNLQPTMKTMKTLSYKLQEETASELGKIPTGTVAEAESNFGLHHGEPLLLAMDGLLRYAKAYRKRFESNLSDDGVLGQPWLKAATGLRVLLNGNGAVAMERGLSKDSKDNGAIEGIFWAAMEAAGFKEEDI